MRRKQSWSTGMVTGDIVRWLCLCILAAAFIFSGAISSFAQDGKEYTDGTGNLAVKKAPLKTSEESQEPIRIEDLKTPKFSIDRDQIKGCEDVGPSGSPEITEPKSLPPNSLNQLFLEELFNKLIPEKQLEFAISECLPANYQWMTIPPGHEYLSQWPNHTMGMLLFDTPEGTSRCTASIIGQRLLLTAGHCVCDGAGNFYNNFRFYPATRVTNPLDPGVAWAYEAAYTFRIYLESGAWCRDVAFLVMRQKDNQHIGNVYGWLGFTADRPADGQTWYIFGYPAYLGDLLLINLSSFYQRADLGCEPFDILVSSNHNKGSSGGPWTLYLNDTFFANSVNSAISPGCTQADMSTALFAPYFDKEVYNAVVGLINN